MPYLDRASFIELLKRLGAETDAELLAAAREINRRVQAADVSWDELLVRAPGTAPIDRLEDYDDPDVDVSTFEIRDRHGDLSLAEQEPVPPHLAELFAAEIELIDTLLARPALAIETRRELLDLRADIAANEFTDMDRRYLRDLAARLNLKTGPN
jgi:hypothetical protein